MATKMNNLLDDLKKEAGIKDYFKENYGDRVTEIKKATTLGSNQSGKRGVSLSNLGVPNPEITNNVNGMNKMNDKMNDMMNKAAPGIKKSLNRSTLLRGAGIGATIGAAGYLHGRSKRKKEQEPNVIRSYHPTAEESVNKGLEEYNRRMSEREKTAAAPKREEIVQRRKLASSLKKKVKKKGVKKLKKGIHKPVRQKKTANFNDTELEKIASLMADQFIAATSLQNVDPDNMNFEQEVLAGYKSFIDEVNVDGVE